MTEIEIGSRLRALRSWREYGKIGRTTVISSAEARLAASMSRNNSMIASLSEYPLTSAND